METNRLRDTFLAILTLAAVGFVLKAAQAVVLPLVIAWLLSYILAPIIDAMARKKVPTILSVSFVLVILLGIFYLGGAFLYARISAFHDAFPKYQERLTEIALAFANQLNPGYDPFAGINWGENVRGLMVSFSGTLFGFVSKLVMVMIFLFFLLLGHPDFKFKIRKAFSSVNAIQVSMILNSISSQIQRYLTVQVLISFVTGVLVWFSLTLIGVDFAVTWGAVAFFLNFIPTVGSILASIPPVLVALVQFYPTLSPAVFTLICVVSIQMVIGNGIAPKVFGDSLNLSPVVVLLSLLFWGWLWGPVGALLSIPIAASIKIVCENIEPLYPISIIMGSGKGYRKEFDR
jgi:AI-2 transport protein TqsA